jgi:hypothetical protein
MILFPPLLAAAIAVSPPDAAHHERSHATHQVGLGAVFTTPDGGQIFGFDVDRNGSDAIYDSSVSSGIADTSSVGTFDQNTGKVIKIVKTVHSPKGNDEVVTFGIVGADVGFVDDEQVHLDPVTRHDLFDLLNPVSGNKITAHWLPPHAKGNILWSLAPNQNSDTQVAMMINGLHAYMYVWDSATNAFLKRFQVPFVTTSVAVDTVTNQAVLAGDQGNGAPTITLIDLKNGDSFTFVGLNNGFAVGPSSLAVDSNTGVACTPQSGNAQVVFYTLSNGVGTAVQLPRTNSGSQLNSGAAVTNDPINKLFLVAQPYSTTASSGSSIDVYDETGDLIETLNGFNFQGLDRVPQFPVKIAINPSQRVGWVQGPSVSQLQQFFY